ncbi:LAFE_0H05160g1_1 [Lachancea fermentati]|uniref:LAFE_0H05160g1_1 n=1 Tax=Lachancea fermentati TaxID=4955 RepID=A0A1G4MJL3_LACFM|nr:LAFE_0H05160g1_1 [Lachancea fermentati]
MNMSFPTLAGSSAPDAMPPPDAGLSFGFMDAYTKSTALPSMPPAVAAEAAPAPASMGPSSTGSASNSAGNTPTPDSHRSSSKKASRLTWKGEEDVAMLTIVLGQRLRLRETTQYRKFWDKISELLLHQYGILRNTRQCRDRFNLLYAKGARNVTNNVTPCSERDKLLHNIVTTFKLSQKGHIVLQDATNSDLQFEPLSHQSLRQDAASDQLSEAPSDYDYSNIPPNNSILRPPSGPVPAIEWKNMSEMVNTLMNCTNGLAMEIQSLGERFSQLTEQMNYLQKRMDYTFMANPSNVRPPPPPPPPAIPQDQCYPYTYQSLDRPK